MKFFKPKFWDYKKISFWSISLFPFTLIIRLLASFKYLITKSQRFSIPVICVGNIYLGGTGKTPFCIKLFHILKNLKKNPAFIRKEYQSFEDEVSLLKQIGEVYKDKKRSNAISNAINDGKDVVILDDGFQDFSIYKKLSIVCFDESQWIGNGLTIPSGPLREQLSALKRAEIVIINGKKNTNIENIILEKNKNLKIFYTTHNMINVNGFTNSNIIAFAGIGNPKNFFDLLNKNNITIKKKISFPDHHKYTSKDLDSLINTAKINNSILLTTEKDYIKISKKYKENIFCIKILTKIENESRLIETIKNFI